MSLMPARPQPASKIQPRKAWLNALLLIALAAAFVLPRALELGRLVTADEPMYLKESAAFYYALTHGEFASTDRVIQPGVTSLWAGTAGFLWLFPEYRQVGGLSLADLTFRQVLGDAGFNRLELLAAGRAFMLLAHASAFLLSFVFARRLLGTPAAAAGFLLIAFDPFYLGHTRLLHPDGLLASLMFLALLSFVDYLRARRWTALAVSAVAAGLSWLTKTPGLFLIPVFALLAGLDWWRNRSGAGSLSQGAAWKRYVAPLVGWALAGLAVFVLLWPAMWVEPFSTFLEHVSFTLESAAGQHTSRLFFDGQVFLDGALGARYSYFYPLTFLWRTTPVVIAGLLIAAFAFIRRDEPGAGEAVRTAQAGRSLAALALFALIFAGLMTVSTKKFDRYLLPVYPPLDLLAGAGWAAAGGWLRSRQVDFLKRRGMAAVFVVALGVQLPLALGTFPYYLSYYNPLMGGPREAPDVMLIGWGEGLDQAARYLNRKPDIHDKAVLAWYSASFDYHFDAVSSHMPIGEINDGWFDQMVESDYAVIYIQQWQRRASARLLDYLEDQEPEHSIWIDGLEYVRIYDLRAIRGD